MDPKRHGLHRFCRNDRGRDYVVGDIHGCFDLLASLLAHIDFDRRHDRLFVLGDLIDRGPQSTDVAAWLSQPWLYAICGNHEAMMLAATRADGRVKRSGSQVSLWHVNGGDWYFDLPSRRQDAIRRLIAALPLAIEVAMPNGMRAGLVHADVLAHDWSRTCSCLRADRDAAAAHDAHMHVLWSRERAQAALQARLSGDASDERIDVAGIDVVYFGHTPMDAPLALGNTRWLDTGAVHGGRLSVAELALEGRVWSLSSVSSMPETGWCTLA